MKKIIKFIKKYQLIIFLALIAGILTGYQIFFVNNQAKQPIFEPTPAPSPTPTIPIIEGKGITKEQFVKKIIDQFPLTPYLPYPEDDASIIYTAPLSLEITLKKPDSNSRREKILDWIRQQGVDPQTHEISWQSDN